MRVSPIARLCVFPGRNRVYFRFHSILNGSTFDVSFEAMQKSYRKPEENKLASLQSNDLQIQIEDTETKAGLCLKIRKLLRSIFIKEKQPRTIKTGLYCTLMTCTLRFYHQNRSVLYCYDLYFKILQEDSLYHDSN